MFVSSLFYLPLTFFLLIAASASLETSPKAYVVYMGGSSIDEGEDVENMESSHLQLLSSISSRKLSRESILHHYHHAFSGFSAFLTENEASALSSREDVVSVFPDSFLHLHTTRSWDFLEVGSSERIRSRYHHPRNDVIIGIIDTGVWPESPSFDDEGLGEIPARWKGTCMETSDFKRSNCNRKLIGARYYDVSISSSNGTEERAVKLRGTPRDSVGHGTHTASTAGGARVQNASYYGLAEGVARGGSPSARIATYKACSEEGCSSSAILKAMDDAIKDGVDIISISIGTSSLFQVDYLNDPIAIGAFHAEQMGVMVVCSGGNDGPEPSTVINTAPWIFTVGASSIDREFQSTLVLGNGKKLRGSAINFLNGTSSREYPIVFGGEVAAKYVPVNESRNCYPGSLDPKKVSGKIVVCINSDPTLTRRVKKLVVEGVGAKGMVLVDGTLMGNPFDAGLFPFTQVDDSAGSEILKYIGTTKNPSAVILPTHVVSNSSPAPSVAYFSSRGPGVLTENILKPDIIAPGIAILAATVPTNDASSVPKGKKPSGYILKSGTSMACPHVAGSAAIIRSMHQWWSPSVIKSALMTTATLSSNVGKPLTDSFGQTASPHEAGSGEISPYKALHPGLAYETTTEDYLLFLCYYGYPENKIRAIARTKTKFTSCPKHSTGDLISNINYPSISIQTLSKRGAPITVKRTVTNFGPINSTYIAAVESPRGLVVEVSPHEIAFSPTVRRASYRVTFRGTKAAGDNYNFGSITWSDGRHSVRTVFSVNVVA
ncbi:hypothetical protein MLD38_024092 [Melastoma candidum]|uniref:Uncharacterized protein n=1 Tax=Melastoma candidum TaxID=119954 RepID=A0ACB9NS93_9MYRT|nr:hypothetical protein MLD38_024092 [Melastoma candidum]